MTFSEGDQPTHQQPQTWEKMSDLRGSGIIRNLGGQSEMIPPAGIYASDYIREDSKRLSIELKNLVQGLAHGILHFFSKVETPQEEIGGEDLLNRTGALIGYYRPGVPLHMEPGVFYATGKVTREQRIDLQQPDLPETFDHDSDSSDPETP